jgi:hypothetical protein
VRKTKFLVFFLKFCLRNLPRKFFTRASKNLVPPLASRMIRKKCAYFSVWRVTLVVMSVLDRGNGWLNRSPGPSQSGSSRNRRSYSFSRPVDWSRPLAAGQRFRVQPEQLLLVEKKIDKCQNYYMTVFKNLTIVILKKKIVFFS